MCICVFNCDFAGFFFCRDTTYFKLKSDSLDQMELVFQVLNISFVYRNYSIGIISDEIIMDRSSLSRLQFSKQSPTIS